MSALTSSSSPAAPNAGGSEQHTAKLFTAKLFTSPTHPSHAALTSYFSTLEATFSSSVNFKVIDCDSESQDTEDECDLHDILSIPTFIIVNAAGEVKGREEKGDTGQFTSMLTAALKAGEGAAAGTALTEVMSEQDKLELRIRNIIGTKGLVVFIKGTRDNPRCGFTGKMIDILNATEVNGCPLQYETFDILGPDDQDVRAHAKKMFDWPTFPMVFHNGEMIGGLDVIKEMQEDGEWEEMFE